MTSESIENIINRNQIFAFRIGSSGENEVQLPSSTSGHFPNSIFNTGRDINNFVSTQINDIYGERKAAVVITAFKLKGGQISTFIRLPINYKEFSKSSLIAVITDEPTHSRLMYSLNDRQITRDGLRKRLAGLVDKLGTIISPTKIKTDLLVTIDGYSNDIWMRSTNNGQQPFDFQRAIQFADRISICTVPQGSMPETIELDTGKFNRQSIKPEDQTVHKPPVNVELNKESLSAVILNLLKHTVYTEFASFQEYIFWAHRIQTGFEAHCGYNCDDVKNINLDITTDLVDTSVYRDKGWSARTVQLVQSIGKYFDLKPYLLDEIRISDGQLFCVAKETKGQYVIQGAGAVHLDQARTNYSSFKIIFDNIESGNKFLKMFKSSPKKALGSLAYGSTGELSMSKNVTGQDDFQADSVYRSTSFMLNRLIIHQDDSDNIQVITYDSGRPRVKTVPRSKFRAD